MKHNTSIGEVSPTMFKEAALASLITTSLLFGFGDATQAQVPKVDITQTCRAASGAMVQMAGESRSKEDDFKSCMAGEQKAREQIVKDWASFSAADKAQCVQTKVYLPSYIEWQTCLEMHRDVRQLRKSQSAPATNEPTAATSLPAPPMIPPIMNDARRPGWGSTTPIKLPVERPGTNKAARPARSP
jgi:hypothetical protein